MKLRLRLSCQQLVTAVKAGNICNSCQSWQQFVTAVKAADNELTLAYGIIYLNNFDVEMKLRLNWQQQVIAVEAGNSL